jgi:hypothetical protein
MDSGEVEPPHFWAMDSERDADANVLRGHEWR